MIFAGELEVRVDDGRFCLAGIRDYLGIETL